MNRIRHFILPTNSELKEILGAAHADFERLCREGCNRLALNVLLFTVKNRLHVYVGPDDESPSTRKARRADADLLTRAAAVIERNYKGLVATPKTDPPAVEGLEAYDEGLAKLGLVSPNRLVRGLRREAALFASYKDDVARGMELRPNQRNFDMISRYVFCGYVKRATGRWHDPQISSLLSTIGNATKADFDAEDLRKWRRTNFARLNRHFSYNVGNLFDSYHRQSSPSK